jgi:hypothetical protein
MAERKKGYFAKLAEDTKAKAEAAAKLAREKKAAKDKSSSDTAGSIFDLALGAGAAALAIPSGGLSLAALPGIVGTGLMAKQASESIREGVTEGDAEKALSGAVKAGGAYKGVTEADGPDYAGLFEGKTDEEIEKILEQDEMRRVLERGMS